MLHSAVYNNGLSSDLRLAYSNRDSTFLINEIKALASQIIDVNSDYDADHEQYNILAPRLYICLALVDSIKTRAITVQFCNDIINF